MIQSDRRNFIKDCTVSLAGLSALGAMGCNMDSKKKAAAMKEVTPFFKISLAQWSLHRSIEKKEIDVLDFAAITRNDFDIGAIEYVNQFYAGRAEDAAYLLEVMTRAEDHDVKSLLIMIDDEGELGNTNDKERLKAVENHYKWVDAAKFLGCHSVRINAFGEGSRESVGAAMVDGLGKLCTYAAKSDINVLIENHGLYSSDAQWVANVINEIDMTNCGTLPDFGNFCLSEKWGSTQDGTCKEVYDRYQGVREMLPFAQGVSAKSYAFDNEGMETTIDYGQMLRIVKDSGFSGYIGIEYEGNELSEMEGIRATRDLLLRAARSI